MRFKTLAAAAATLAVTAAGATPLTFNGNTYNVGTAESVLAPFVTAAGTATASTYSGYVLVNVSGLGNGAWGGTNNDAFGYLAGGSTRSDCGSLTVRTLALPGGCNNYALNAIVYDVDQNVFVNALGGNFVANYRAGSDYSFVISVDKLLAAAGQSTAQKLWFGTSDGVGNYGDNGGNFTVSVAQLTLESGTVPEPGALSLVLAAAGLAAAARRRAV